MCTKKREYYRSIDLFEDITKKQGVYFALSFLYDSQYEKEDIKKMMLLIESNQQLRKKHIQNQPVT